MKKFDNVDLIKIVALGCDFFASFILSLLLAIQGDERAQAISAIVLSVVVPTVAYIIGAIICFIFIVRSDRQYWPQALLVTIGGLVYLVGDNLPSVMEGYGNQLNCCDGSSCFQQIQAAGFGLLVIATVTNFPTFIDKLLFHSKGDQCNSDTIPIHVRVFFLMASFHELDTLYSALQRVTSTCPDGSTVIGIWISWVVFTVTFLLVLLLSVNLYFRCNNSICDCIGSNIHSVLMFIGLASYLLADNRLPLACTGAAKSIYTNTVSNTLNSTLCNTIDYNNTLYITQVSLWAPAVTIAFYALFFTCGWYACCMPKNNKDPNNGQKNQLELQSPT